MKLILNIVKKKNCSQEIHVQFIKHIAPLGGRGGSLWGHLRGHVTLENWPTPHHLLLALVEDLAALPVGDDHLGLSLALLLLLLLLL